MDYASDAAVDTGSQVRAALPRCRFGASRLQALGRSASQGILSAHRPPNGGLLQARSAEPQRAKHANLRTDKRRASRARRLEVAMTRRAGLTACAVVALGAIWLNDAARATGRESRMAAEPQFELVQPDLFAASGGQPNCWADYDNDGDLDLFVGFREGVANKLYRNDNGTFVEVAAEMGVADLNDSRAASWGDFDGDGNIDLFVGFTRKSTIPSKLYRN